MAVFGIMKILEPPKINSSSSFGTATLSDSTGTTYTAKFWDSEIILCLQGQNIMEGVFFVTISKVYPNEETLAGVLSAIHAVSLAAKDDLLPPPTCCTLGWIHVPPTFTDDVFAFQLKSDTYVDADNPHIHTTFQLYVETKDKTKDEKRLAVLKKSMVIQAIFVMDSFENICVQGKLTDFQIADWVPRPQSDGPKISPKRRNVRLLTQVETTPVKKARK